MATSLDLAHCGISDLDEYLASSIHNSRLEQVSRLDLSHNQLEALPSDLSPKLRSLFSPHLMELVLDGNLFSDLTSLPELPRLRVLSVNKNTIADLTSTFEAIKQKLPDLVFLSLQGNPCWCHEMMGDPDTTHSDYLDYRRRVLGNLPNLKFLDASPVTPEERASLTTANGHSPVKVASVVSTNKKHGSTGDPITKEFTSLSSKRFQRAAPAVGYKTLKYEYRGRNSEGNRFITDNNL